MNYRLSAEPTNAAPSAPVLGRARDWMADRPQMPYLLPIFVYVLLMSPAGLGEALGIPFARLWHVYHPWVYGGKTVAAAVLLWWFWPCYARVRWTHLGLGALVGLVGTPVWILIHYGCLKTGWWHPPAADALYNPDVMLSEVWQRWAFLVVRVAGPALVVPVMEELFFRDFLMRALVRGSRFEEVAVGTFTWLSFLGTAVLFGVNHGAMWPGGVVYGVMMGLLLVRTKSLGACMVAHGVTNWTLYLYVIYAGDWQFM